MWFRMAMSQLTDDFINTFSFIKDDFINLIHNLHPFLFHKRNPEYGKQYSYKQ